METLLLVISIVAFGISLKNTRQDKDDDSLWPVVVMITFVAIGGLSFFTFNNIQTVATAHTIDEKIQMYQQENESIEQSVGTAVRAYMDYEKETFGNLSNKEAMNLISLYPDLKSDQLVQKQIDIYVSNNDKIKELREDQIDLAKARWNLYFGH